MSRMLPWLLVVSLWLAGCLSGAFTSRYDPFTGKTTKDGRVGVISTARETYYIHAHAVDQDKGLEIYVVNQAPVTISRLDLLADGQRINLTCLFVREGRRGHITYRLFRCDLDAKQAALLAQARNVKYRLRGIVSQATPQQLRRLAKVLQ